jgi:hypothetical protein
MRSMFDGIVIIERISRREALIKVLVKPHLRPHHRLGRGFIAFLAPWPKMNASASSSGKVMAVRPPGAKGVRLGRKPKLTDRQREAARRWPPAWGWGERPDHRQVLPVPSCHCAWGGVGWGDRQQFAQSTKTRERIDEPSNCSGKYNRLRTKRRDHCQASRTRS